MSTKSKLILAIVALTASYGFGRWSAPEKIRVETIIKEVEKKVDDTKTSTDRDKHKTTTVTETVKPDGTKQTVTTTTEDTQTHKGTEGHSTTENEKDSSTLKEITRATAKVTVSAMYGMPFIGGLPYYGGMISKPIFGPITVGAFYLSPDIIGVTLGLTF